MQPIELDAHNSARDKKAILFAPFWRMVGHVGNNRVDRFVRWLDENGYEVVIIRAGPKEAVQAEAWGQEITIADRLGLHPETALVRKKEVSPRKPNKLRRELAYWLFNPDPTVVWAKAAARHPRVIAAVEGADFILSSSPPESAHVGAWMLSQRTGVPHIMDMRDGWLDEPLKTLLLSSKLRRWQERRLESRIAHSASAIQVTSDVWKELFDARYPELAWKVHVLTNGYPINIAPPKRSFPKTADEEHVLIYAGRFMGSRGSQKPDLLLEPLLRHLSQGIWRGVVQFYGSLAREEVSAIDRYRSRLSEIGWRMEILGTVSRPEMLAMMQRADGLLLLSASHAALPSKLFEYLATGRPILYVAARGSATSGLLDAIAQATDLTSSGGRRLDSRINKIEIPEEFDEKFLREKFNHILQTCIL